MAERELGPGRRRALFIAIDKYEDEELSRFPVALGGVEALAAALVDPAIGRFDRQALLDESAAGISRGLGGWLRNAGSDDLLLLYICGHALVDGDGLLFATANTMLRAPRETAIPSDTVRELIDKSPAGQVVVFLETPVVPDPRSKILPSVRQAAQQLEGPRRVVISTTHAAGTLTGESLSGAMAEGLVSGDADMNGDGLVDIDELYVYLSRRLSTTTGVPPERSAVNLDRQVVIARNARAAPSPPPPPTPPPAATFDTDSVAASDLYATVDSLGYRPYAEAIAAFVRHPETRPPLTIGIKAPWGAGKTSLMRMVQNELDPPEDPRAPPGTEQRATIRLTSESRTLLYGRRSGRKREELRRVTVGTVLSKLQDEEPEEVRAAAPQDDELRGIERDEWRPTVWFNPWMYQSGEQVWAGFAHEVIDQVTKRMPRAEREHFWLSLNLARVDEDAVRRKVHRVLFERLVPVALAFVAILAVGLVGLALEAAFGVASWLEDLISGVFGGGAVLALAWGVLRFVGFRREAAAGSLDRLVREPTYTVKFGDVITEPGYEDRLGFLYLVQTDIRRVLDLVATPERPLVVFVDDLDRCSPGTVTQVIEAINLFLAGEFPNCIFVLAMEPEVVAAHIEVAHESLVKMLAERGGEERAGTLGWRFLEKIVQLPLSLPSPSEPLVSTFLGTFLASGDAAGDSVATPVPRVPVSELISEPDDAGPGGSPPAPPPMAPDTRREQHRAVQQELARRLARDSEEVRAIVAAVAPHLGGNPREIKRFVNVFRFYAFVQQSRTATGLGEDALLQVAKLAVLAIRWPHLRDVLGGPVKTGAKTTVLAQLITSLHTNGVQPPPSLDQQLDDAGVRVTVRQTLIASADLCAFLKQEPRLEASVAELL